MQHQAQELEESIKEYEAVIQVKIPNVKIIDGGSITYIIKPAKQKEDSFPIKKLD